MDLSVALDLHLRGRIRRSKYLLCLKFDLCRACRPLACRRRRLGLVIWTQCIGPRWGKPKATDGEQVELVSPVTLSCLRQESKVVTGEQVELVSPVNQIHLRQGPMGRSR